MTTATAIRSREHGHTLVEVLVAATLFVVFVVGLYGTSIAFFSLLEVQKSRTESLTAMNVARARMVADARAAAAVGCSGSDTLEVTTAGSPPGYIQYSSDGSRLLRWVSDDDKTYRVADGARSVDCSSLGSAGVDVEIAFGREEDPFALHVSLLDAPPPTAPEPPGGGGGGGGWGKGGKKQ